MTDRSPRAETLGHVYTLFGTGGVSGLTDGQLLERFLSGRSGVSEPAFAALVDRHGPTVLKVCSGVLRDRHDAEDAFQATFLVLALRASSIHKRASVASWLHGVALRVASASRSNAARRRKHELRAVRAEAVATAEPALVESTSIVHEEIGRLPDRYRAPVVLCFLEGLSHEDAAQQLSWPVGTVKSRLARAKDHLKGRLTRRGLANAAVPLFFPNSTPALAPVARELANVAVRSATLGTTSPAVNFLVKGTLRAMNIVKWKAVAAGLLAVGVVGTGVGVLAGQAPGDRPAENRRPVGVERQATAEDSKDDRSAILVLERRITELEKRLDALSDSKSRERSSGDGSDPNVDPNSTIRVRPRCEAIVTHVGIRPDGRVKKGQVIAQLMSLEVAQDKSKYLQKLSVSQKNQRVMKLRKKLAEQNAISTQLLVDTENELDQSLIELSQARDRLSILYGMSSAEIDRLIPEQEGETKATLYIRSPVDGTVASVNMQPQDYVSPKDVLAVIKVSLDTDPH